MLVLLSEWKQRRFRHSGLPLFHSPADFLFSQLAQTCVDCGEGAASEKTAVSRERRRVRGGEDGMPGPVDERCLLLRRIAPENKNKGPLKTADGPDDGIRECFPPASLMGIRRMGADGQNRIQRSSEPLSGTGTPRSSCSSRKMLRSEGGSRTPGRTENASPCA